MIQGCKRLFVIKMCPCMICQRLHLSRYLLRHSERYQRYWTSLRFAEVSFKRLSPMLLRKIVRSVLYHSSVRLAAAADEAPIDVLYILRGGLNYNLHQILTKVTRRHPEVSFLSSQRTSTEENFVVTESDYEKWSIQNDAVLCLERVMN